ncbi:MAG: hypothetical protein H7267_10710 [Sandarakinorhabdus sp.]|nr:hypothetical protein [Sandarakinorhabdus sp.]
MRHYVGSALMLFVTTAVIVGSYTVNLKVSAERAQVERLQRTLVTDARGIRDLQAELRTRARLPEMQRWNDTVLMMAAPAAGQYLRGPLQLAHFAMPEASVQTVQRAVTTPVAIAPPSLAAPIIRAAWRPAPAPDARVVTAAYHPASPAHTVPPLVIIPETAAASGAPVDLLHEGGQ